MTVNPLVVSLIIAPAVLLMYGWVEYQLVQHRKVKTGTLAIWDMAWCTAATVATYLFWLGPHQWRGDMALLATAGYINAFLRIGAQGYGSNPKWVKRS